MKVMRCLSHQRVGCGSPVSVACDLAGYGRQRPWMRLAEVG
jgi:hypothetical protein